MALSRRLKKKVSSFLGYLMPGAISLYSLVIIDYLKKIDDYSIEGFTKCLVDFKFEGIST